MENFLKNKTVIESIYSVKPLANFKQDKTVVFVIKKDSRDLSAGAKSVILTASEPLAFKAMCPLLDKLHEDKRVRVIALITNNMSRESFTGYLRKKSYDLETFFLKGDGIDKAEGEELKRIIGGDFDIVMASIDAYRGPGRAILNSGKEYLGAKKMFIIHYGWTSSRRMKKIFTQLGITAYGKKTINGIFCNDELARKIISLHLPSFKKRIKITGSPVIEGLGQDKAMQYKMLGRKKLAISNLESAVLYLGDTLYDYGDDKKVDRYLNEKTLAITVEAMSKLAEKHPERKFTLLIRPHPRDRNKFRIMSYTHFRILPKNLRLISALPEKISINEAVYAADAILSIISTENNLAPLRGKPGIFLAFPGNNHGHKLGGYILQKILGSKAMTLIRKVKYIYVVRSEIELIHCLSNCLNRRKNKARKSLIKSITAEGSTEKILDTILN